MLLTGIQISLDKQKTASYTQLMIANAAKKIGLTMILLIMFVGIANAAENGDGVKVTLGLKNWITTWTATPNGWPGKPDLTSPVVLITGPTVKLSYGKVYGGFSYTENVSKYNFEGNDGSKNIQFQYTRSDIDFLLGYFVHPNISLFLGYKYFTGSSNLKDSTYNMGVHKGSGLVIGASFNLLIEKLYIVPYLNIAYMPLEGESQTNANPDTGRTTDLVTTYRLPGYVIEGGISTLPFHNFAASIGYKYQVMDWDNEARDTIRGATVSLNYLF